VLLFSAALNNAMQRKSMVKLKLKGGKGGKPLPTVKIKKPTMGAETMDMDKKGGPANASGFVSALDSKRGKKNNLFEPQKFSLGVEKAQTMALNTNMTQRSLFDTLYEEVMDNPSDMDMENQDLDALDVDVSDDMGDEAEITISLPRELAQKLHDALMGQLEGDMEDEMTDEEMGAEDLGADMGDEDFGDDDEDEGAFPESVVVEPSPKPLGNKGHQLMGKGKMKVGGTVTGKSGGKANASVKVDVEAEPKPLGNKGHSLMGKGSMKVNSSLTPGKSIFD
jgi:hypothetical protein